MGRRSLSGLPPRTRTVDDDLADQNLTRQDIAVGEYSFKRVWGHLRASGWYAKPGPALSYDHFYIKPGKTLADGVEGVDYFYGEANLVTYGRAVRLFEQPAGSSEAASPSSGCVAQVDQATLPAATTSSAMATNGASAGPSPTVKEEGEKSQGNGKRRLKRASDVERRQWPATHRRKGGHAGDAICIDSDSDDDEQQEEEAQEPKRPGNPGKRKAPPILDDDDEDDGEDSGGNDAFDAADDVSVGSVASDATGYSAASATSKRPLLTTRGPKKQKLKPAKKYKAPGPLPGRKRKSGPRGLMFQTGPARETLEQSPPEATPTVKEEPPVYFPSTPPPRVSSRASSVTSSHRSSSLPRTSPTEAQSQRSSSTSRTSATTRLLEVEGVVFPSRPAETYRVTITRDTSTDETTIWMEEQESLEQRQITFTDITVYSDETVPERAIHQALHCSLLALAESVIVPQPNTPESRVSSASNEASAIDLVRDESSVTIQLRFPDSPIWTVLHRFPMEAVPESAQVRALRGDLARATQQIETTEAQLQTTRQDLEVVRGELQATRSQLTDTQVALEAARRDRDAFKMQHEQLEKEYQKLRAAQSLTRPAQHQPTLPVQSQPRAPSPSPPKARSLPTSQSQTPPRAQSQSQGKQLQPRVQPSSQAKSPSKPQGKARPAPQRQVEQGHARQKSPVRASSPASTTTTTAPSADPVLPSTERDPKMFRAEGKWLDTTFPKGPAGSPWVVQWTKLICANPTHFSVASDRGKLTEVTMKAPGSYQLDMIVNHASTMLLSIVITAAESGVRRVSYHPQLIQICPAASGPRYISHFHQAIQCSVGDSIFAELRPCTEPNPPSGRVEQLDKFSPPPNDWRIEWKHSHNYKSGATNGKQTNGMAD